MSETATTAMNIVPKTTILIPAKDTEKILTMLQAGVFDLDSGKIEINIHNGQVQNIHINRMTYKRTSATL